LFPIQFNRFHSTLSANVSLGKPVNALADLLLDCLIVIFYYVETVTLTDNARSKHGAKMIYIISCHLIVINSTHLKEKWWCTYVFGSE